MQLERMMHNLLYWKVYQIGQQIFNLFDTANPSIKDCMNPHVRQLKSAYSLCKVNHTPIKHQSSHSTPSISISSFHP